MARRNQIFPEQISCGLLSLRVAECVVSPQSRGDAKAGVPGGTGLASKGACKLKAP